MRPTHLTHCCSINLLKPGRSGWALHQENAVWTRILFAGGKQDLRNRLGLGLHFCDLRMNTTASSVILLQTEEPSSKSWSRSGPENIRVALYIPLLVLGTVGNILSFLVMRRKSLRVTSPGLYFAAIAVGDTVALFAGVLPFIIFYFSSVDLWSFHPWSCKIVIFTLFTSSDAAVWLVVAVTVDRFIAIKFPLKAKQLCTPKKARIVAVCLPVVAIFKNFHLFFTRGRQILEDPELPEEQWLIINCGFPTPAIEYFENYVRNWIALALFWLIPVISVIVLNTFIVLALWKVRQVGPSQDSSQQSANKQQERARKSNSQLTAMFLSVSITFVLFLTPSITLIVVRPYLRMTKEQATRYDYAQSFVDPISYLMHSTNFFLYCLTGAGFRRELRRLFGARTTSDRDETSATGGTARATWGEALFVCLNAGQYCKYWHNVQSASPKSHSALHPWPKRPPTWSHPEVEETPLN